MGSTQRHGTDFQRGLTDRTYSSTFARPGKFGRMFPTLPPGEFDPRFLQELGKRGGVMDEGDGDAAGDSPTVHAGFTSLGQFIDHDITFDPTSSLERQNDPEAVWNFRTPLLELDSVYGSGPAVSPFLYAKPARGGAPEKLLLGRDEKGQPQDLPRNGEGTALIGDP